MYGYEVLDVIQNSLEKTQDMGNSIIMSVERKDDPHRGEYLLIIGLLDKHNKLVKFELDSSYLNCCEG